MEGLTQHYEILSVQEHSNLHKYFRDFGILKVHSYEKEDDMIKPLMVERSQQNKPFTDYSRIYQTIH